MQNWNDILSFIKLELGAKLNLIEMSDTEIVDNLKQHILPKFSQFSEKKKETRLTLENKVEVENGANINTFRIPLDDDEYIIDIFDVYFKRSELDSNSHFVNTPDMHGYDDNITSTYINQGASYGRSIPGEGFIDMAISNMYSDIASFLSVRNTWEYRPPDLLLFDLPVSTCIITYCIAHQTLSTIRQDLYHSTFKIMCLGYVQKWLAALRSKYENISTPFNPINVNWQKLEQDAEKNIELANRNLDTIPPDHLIHITY